MKEQSDMPRQTPLVELLLAVPEDARLIYEHSPTESQSIPVGPMCRQAAMELATATRERDEARAEVERLRPLTICGCGDHFAVNFEGTCPNCKWEEKRP